MHQKEVDRMNVLNTVLLNINMMRDRLGMERMEFDEARKMSLDTLHTIQDSLIILWNKSLDKKTDEILDKKVSEFVMCDKTIPKRYLIKLDVIRDMLEREHGEKGRSEMHLTGDTVIVDL